MGTFSPGPRCPLGRRVPDAECRWEKHRPLGHPTWAWMEPLRPAYNQEGRLMTPLQGWEPTGLRPGCLAHSQTGIRSAERVKLGKTQEESQRALRGHSGFCFGNGLRGVGTDLRSHSELMTKLVYDPMFLASLMICGVCFLLCLVGEYVCE